MLWMLWNALVLLVRPYLFWGKMIENIFSEESILKKMTCFLFGCHSKIFFQCLPKIFTTMAVRGRKMVVDGKWQRWWPVVGGEQ